MIARAAGAYVHDEQGREMFDLPDAPLTDPGNALQHQVSRLRKALGPARVASRGPGYALDLPPDTGRNTERDTLLPAVVAQTGFDSNHVDILLFGPDPETNEDLVHLASALESLVDAVTRIR